MIGDEIRRLAQGDHSTKSELLRTKSDVKLAGSALALPGKSTGTRQAHPKSEKRILYTVLQHIKHGGAIQRIYNTYYVANGVIRPVLCFGHKPLLCVFAHLVISLCLPALGQAELCNKSTLF